MGMSIISEVAFNIHKAWLQRNISSLYCTPTSSIDDTHTRGYSIALVSALVQDLVKAQPEVLEHLYEALRTYEVVHYVCIGEVITSLSKYTRL